MSKRRLKTLGSRVQTGRTDRVRPIRTTEQRMTGRPLQRRRERLWLSNPKCVVCGRLTEFPHGFELDHRVPLWQGGDDTDANCQILCVWYDEDGNKRGCHADKTAEEAGER